MLVLVTVLVFVLVLVLASRLFRGIPIISGHPDCFGTSRLFWSIPNLFQGRQSLSFLTFLGGFDACKQDGIGHQAILSFFIGYSLLDIGYSIRFTDY